MCSIPCRAACNKALRPTVGSKLSPSGDVASQTVAFARRFADSPIAIALRHRSSSGDFVVTAREAPRFRISHFNALART
jgi:hypothetical protein